MKSINKIATVFVVSISVSLLTGCQREVLDFGNNRAFSGVVKDASGNIVPGTVTKNDLSVYLLGEGETDATVLRVDGEGNYQNTKLYPQVYKAWVEGPIFMDNPSDTIMLNFINSESLVQEWVVIPYLSIASPEIAAPTASSVEVSYAITGNNGKTASEREIYCSTNPYPTTSTGTGLGYQTVEKNLSSDSGVIEVTGLEPNTKYYVRIGGSADGLTWNYSDQVTFTTP